MYTCMGLPTIIKEVTAGLEDEVIGDCLSHILLTGGNTDLLGFALRLRKDLREILPEHSPIIEVRSCPGTHSWNVAMGSTYVSLAVHPGEIYFSILIDSLIRLRYPQDFEFTTYISHNNSRFNGVATRSGNLEIS